MDSSFVDHEEEVPTMNTYSCDSCGKTYKTLANLKRHLDDTHSYKLFQCETCDKQFTAKGNILSHHKRRHQQSDTTYLCPHCGKKYLTESSMYSHVRYKHKQAGQLCKFCNKRFKHNYALDRHMKKHDNKKDVCPRCCGLFKDVKQHALSCKITKTKAHKCGYCDKVFVEKRYLSDHIDKKHLKPKIHVCKCGKSYSYVYALRRHEKSCNSSSVA